MSEPRAVSPHDAFPTASDADSATCSRPLRSRILRVMRVPASVIGDGIVVAGGGVILWSGGGATVVDGPWLVQASCLLLVALLLLARSVLVDSLGIERIVVGADVVVLVSLIAAWLVSQLYFVGWLAAFGALVLVIASMWQLLAILVTRRAPLLAEATPRRSRRRRSRSRERAGWSLPSLRASSIGVGLAALLVLAPIHGGSPAILSGLVVLLSGAVFLSFAMRIWITALARTS